jgi:predicted nucleotidyltransferase
MKTAKPDFLRIKGFSESIDLIKTRFNVFAIYIFGSRARGDVKPDSDLDICVLLEDSSVRPLDAMREIRLALCDLLRMPLDILVYRKDRFMERRDAGASLERAIDREGIAV